MGLIVISSKRAYAIHRSDAPRAPTAPAAGHFRPISQQEILKLSLYRVSESRCGQDFVWALQASLVGIECDSKYDFTPPTILLVLLLGLGCGVSFWGIQYSVNSCSAASCNFGVLAEEDECMSYYSAILFPKTGQTGDGKSERQHFRNQRTKMDWNGWI